MMNGTNTKLDNSRSKMPPKIKVTNYLSRLKEISKLKHL